MAGQVKFFVADDPFNLTDWEVQNGPNPNRTKTRAGALTKDGDEFHHAQCGANDAGTITYTAKKFTGFLTVPAAGAVADGWHIDSGSVTYNQKGFPTLTLNVHKHVDGNEDANCRTYVPSFKVPAVAIGIPTSIPLATAQGQVTDVFKLSTSAVVGIRGMSLAWGCNHVDEDDNKGDHFAGDNYDGNETLNVEFTGEVDPEEDYTLHADWTDDNLARNGGNTVASTTSLTATHHIPHYVAPTGGGDGEDD